MTMDQEPDPSMVEFVATPEEIEAAWERLADLGKLDHLVPGLLDEVVGPFEKAGVDLADDRVLTAIMVTCRLIVYAIERLAQRLEDKDLSAMLLRSVARQMGAEACDTFMANVVRAHNMARMRPAT
jgi:hypothetical protein